MLVCYSLFVVRKAGAKISTVVATGPEDRNERNTRENEYKDRIIYLEVCCWRNPAITTTGTEYCHRKWAVTLSELVQSRQLILCVLQCLKLAFRRRLANAQHALLFLFFFASSMSEARRNKPRFQSS